MYTLNQCKRKIGRVPEEFVNFMVALEVINKSLWGISIFVSTGCKQKQFFLIIVLSCKL